MECTVLLERKAEFKQHFEQIELAMTPTSSSHFMT